jgi:hypothetical protein
MRLNILRYAPAVVVLGMLGPMSPAAATKVCRPAIEIQSHELARPYNLRRIWTANVSIDASTCATESGLFSLRIVRSAENAPDLEFVQPLLWRTGQKKLTFEFWIDETVVSAEMSAVADCPCLAVRD